MTRLDISLSAAAVAALLLAGASADARPIRAGAATSIRAGGARNSSGNANINRNTNINRNVNVHRDVNVDVDNHWDNGRRYHPVATGVAIGTAAAVTAAVIGSVAYSLPPACVNSMYGGVAYYHCGSVWYQPSYAGTSVTYVVVNQPS